MQGWTLARVPRLTAGEGAAERIAQLVRPLLELGRERGRGAGSVLLVADPALSALGVVPAVEGALTKAGLGCAVFTEFKSDPTFAQVDAAAALVRSNAIGAIVAVGGGSALDLGKAAAVVAKGSLPAVAYALCAKPLPALPLPRVCVPTTAGTGSETTRTAILTDEDGRKKWIWGEEVKAEEVVLDPRLSVSLPPALTAGTGIDALVHAIEAATNRNAFPANDVFAHQAIALATRALPRALERPDDLQARADMLLAAAWAGIAIDNAGTALAHAIGHALGSLAPVHHGRAVGTALLATMNWTGSADEAPWRPVGAAMGETADLRGAVRGFERLLRNTGTDARLHECASLRAVDVAREMARPENEPMRLANRRAVAEADLETLARATLEAA